jgi:hypothetical protein
MLGGGDGGGGYNLNTRVNHCCAMRVQEAELGIK